MPLDAVRDPKRAALMPSLNLAQTRHYYEHRIVK